MIDPEKINSNELDKTSESSFKDIDINKILGNIHKNIEEIKSEIESIHKNIEEIKSEIESIKLINFDENIIESLENKYNQMCEKSTEDQIEAYKRDWKGLLKKLMTYSPLKKEEWYSINKAEINSKDNFCTKVLSAYRISFIELTKVKTYIIIELGQERAEKIAFYKQSIRVLNDPLYKIGITEHKTLDIVDSFVGCEKNRDKRRKSEKSF